LSARALERLAFLVLALGLLAFGVAGNGFSKLKEWFASPTPQEVPAETAPVEETKPERPAARPKPQRRTESAPQLPGMPVRDE
jgi:hypothetical protein